MLPKNLPTSVVESVKMPQIYPGLKAQEILNTVIGWTEKFPRYTFTFREPKRGRLLLIATEEEEKRLTEETVFTRKQIPLGMFGAEQRRLGGILPFK